MKEKIRTLAQEIGFLECGFTSTIELTEEIPHLKQWLNNGFHSSMQYMENHFEKRVNTSLLVEGSKTVISLLYNYYPEKLQRKDAPQIAKYAYGKDYHFIFKEKLNTFLERINNEITPISGRVFTDSAPLLERPLAQKAGLGWRGRNSLLVSPKHGSFFFIGEVVVDLELEPDEPFEKNYCGNCRKCLESCPTSAIVEDGVIDSNRCLSFWTIEHNDSFNEDTPDLHNRMYGCDICQDVCPWNKKSKPHSEPEFNPHERLLTMTSDEWNNLSEEEFREIFRKSAVKRTKYAGLMRNLHRIIS